MAKKPFQMKSAAYGGPMRKNFPSAFKNVEEEEVVKGKTYDTVEVSGGEKTRFDDKNVMLTAEELKKRKINPAPNTKYYVNKKTGRVSTIDWSEKQGKTLKPSQ